MGRSPHRYYRCGDLPRFTSRATAVARPSAEPEVDPVGLPVVEHDPDAPVEAALSRLPVVVVLLGGGVVPVDLAAVRRRRVERLVDSCRSGAALDRGEPHGRGDGLDERAVGPPELELRGDGAAGLEDARRGGYLV